MWKVGTKLNLKTDSNSWSQKSHTLIVQYYEKGFVYCSRKGSSNAVYPYHIDEVEKLSWNPFIRIKRMLCRAFECSYK